MYETQVYFFSFFFCRVSLQATQASRQLNKMLTRWWGSEDERFLLLWCSSHHVSTELRVWPQRQLQLAGSSLQLDVCGRGPAAAHLFHGSKSQSGHYVHPVWHIHFLQSGCAVGCHQSQAQIPRPSADHQPDCSRPLGYLHCDASGCRVEHHSTVVGWWPGLQIPHVPQAASHVLLCFCHSGDKFGQTISYPQPSGHQHGPEEEQDHAGGSVDNEHLALSPSGKTAVWQDRWWQPDWLYWNPWFKEKCRIKECSEHKSCIRLFHARLNPLLHGSQGAN